MTRARRTIGHLVVLSGVAAITVLLVPTPAPAQPAPPRLGLPPIELPLPPLPLPPLPPLLPLPLPPLPDLPLPPPDLSQVEDALAPVADALDEPRPSVEPLVAPPPPAAPAAPAPAEPMASPSPALTATPPTPPAPGSPSSAPAAATPVAPAQPARPALPTAEPAAAGRGPAAAIVRAARSFTPLFVLAAAVVAFLVVQGRIDRRDAKLATAPVASDVLEFR